ncbi:hypothetical protein [Corallococcus exiguus]|uniref:Uncharacterized protein n=1 Tax=Corallococcus exiguus TaxID=83462 RepID=A0A7X4Y499_9BACT|nr:hypothetical protein [Corallococcus exiguus]NBC38275.1 hypothetical protein [Corallococcus exiguus]TNV61487.1 hypothetical protein FH620_20900 [Corallococcus exiguus]
MPLDLEVFQKTQVYQSQATVAEVLEDLRAMDSRPQCVSKAQAEPSDIPTVNTSGLGWGLLLVSAVSFVIFWLLSSEHERTLEGPSSLLLLLCFGSFVGGLLLLGASWTAPRDSSDRMSSSGPEERFVAPYKEQRRLLLTTLLKRFQVDLVQDAPVDVTLDLTLPMDPRKRVHAGKHGTWDREDFSDPWLSLRGRFADGTRLQLTVVEQVRMLERTKTLPLKVKTQRKRSGASLMTVALGVKPERHPGLADMEERLQDAVRLPSGVRLKRLRVAEDRVELRVLLEDDWVARPTKVLTLADVPPGEPLRRPPTKTDAARTATMMLLSLYQVLNHSSSQGQPGKMRSTP